MQKYLYLAAAFLLLPFFISAQPIISGATRVKLFKGDSIFTAPLSSLSSAIGAGGNRPDSAFATGAYNAPVYWQKSVESNIWKKGTLSIRTADTSGIITVRQSDTALTKPSILVNGNGEYIWKVKADTRAGIGTDLNLVRKYGPSGDGNQNNQIFSLGFNVTPGGGMENATYPSASYRIEENFKNGVDNVNAFECHLPHIEFTNNTSRRPLTGYFSRSHVNPKGYWSFDTDFFTIQDYKARSPKVTWGFSENTGYAKGISFLDTALISFAKNNVGGLWQRNAANSAGIRMLMVDDADRILIGGSGPASRVALYNEVQITNNGHLWNEGGFIKIGKNTSTEGSTLELRSGTNNSMYFSSPLANNYLRIGATDEGSSNYMATFFAASGNRWLQAQQDVADRLLNLAGTKVAVNAYAPSQTKTFTVNGTTQLGIGSDANANSILNLKTNAYNADIFVNNQSPEALSTATVGSVALINDGGNGALYGKYSGSGNTGWSKFLNLKDPNGASTNQVLQWNGTAWTPSSVGGIGGSGTTNFVTKWTGPNSIGNSTITDDGTDVGFNWTSKVRIFFNSSYNMGMQKGTGRDLILFANSPDNDAKVSLQAANITALTADHLGNVGIGTTSPSASYKLDIIGKARSQGLRAEGTTMQPSLELANTTPTTGKTFTLGSSNTGTFYISSDVGGDAISVNHATSEVTIPWGLKINTLGTTATSLLGLNASNQVAGVTLGAGLSFTGGTLSASGGSSPTVITPATITTNQNDYSPTGWATSTIVRLAATTEIWAITGFSATDIADGHEKKLMNVGNVSLYLPGEHTGSTAINRITATYDFVLAPKSSCTIVYDGVLDRWLIIGESKDPEIYHFWGAASSTSADWGQVSFNAINAGATNVSQSPTATLPGSQRISTVATSNGGGSISLPKFLNALCERGLGHVYAEGYISLVDLSDATNRYVAGLAFGTSTTSLFSGNNTFGIQYSDNINSGVWEFFSRDNAGSTTTVSLGLTAAVGTPVKLRVEMSGDGNEIRAYLNDEMKGIISTNLPSTGVDLLPKIQLVKSAGTTTRTLDCFAMKAGLYMN